jgi:hypothetical protein
VRYDDPELAPHADDPEYPEDPAAPADEPDELAVLDEVPGEPDAEYVAEEPGDAVSDEPDAGAAAEEPE